jgi:hypothetical protein
MGTKEKALIGEEKLPTDFSLSRLAETFGAACKTRPNDLFSCLCFRVS